MNTSADHPYLDCAYKLQEYAGRPRRKRSEGKATWPGRKQVYRRLGADGRIDSDLLTTTDDSQLGEALLRPVMRDGRRLAPSPSLAQVRQHLAAELARLPPALRALPSAPPYPVVVSPALRDLARRVDLHRETLD
jgi:nicotinate phosphoribosyltransferase